MTMFVTSGAYFAPSPELARRSLLRGAFAAWLLSACLPLRAAAVTAAPDRRDALAVVIDDLVAAGHILSNENIIDAFGHVSGRHPTRRDHFVMSRAVAPGLAQGADIMEFDRDGEPVDAQGRHPYLERYIHAAIYQARPDVNAVVHDHSREVIPFSVSRTRLKPLHPTGGVIGEQVPVWDIRESFGENTNMLVSTLAIGRDLARRLGQGSTVLMRGHGAVIAAKTIRLATFTAINLDNQARLRHDALALGAVTDMSPGEVAETAKLFEPGAQGGSLARAWEYWCGRANVPFIPRGA